MDDEDYQRHEAASAAAPALAFDSVMSMNLPAEIHLSGKVRHLSRHTAHTVKRMLGELSEEYGEKLAFVVAFAVRDLWFACWSGAHYVRLLHEPLLGKIEVTTESRRLWLPEGYAESEGWTSTLYYELSKLTPYPGRAQFLSGTPLTQVPSARSVLDAASLYFFHRAEEEAARGHLKNVVDYLQEAYDALSLNNGIYMWDEGFKIGKEEAASEAASTARRALAKTAAMARHSENRAMKQDVFEWCDKNMASAASMDAAASLVAGSLVPAAWRTVRDWMAEWRKVRSAGTA